MNLLPAFCLEVSASLSDRGDSDRDHGARIARSFSGTNANMPVSGESAGAVLRGGRSFVMRGLLICLAVVSALAFPRPALAQVQSYAISLDPGLNAIANHLHNGGNTLDEVLPVVPEGAQLWKFDPVQQAFTEPAEYSAAFGWFIPEPRVAVLNPGEGAFLSVPTNFTIVLRGTPQPPQPRSDVVPEYNFVSCQVAQPCSFGDVFGFGPIPGDTVYKFDQPIPQVTTDPRQSASSIHRFSINGWDTAPVFETGRSAFVYLAKRPRITRQPADHGAQVGDAVQLSVSALGAEPLSYEWRFYNQPSAGQNSSRLAISSVALSNAGPYSVVVSNPFGSVTSRLARLQVFSAPRVLDPPRPQVKILGEAVTFKVIAEGTAPLTYQWFFEGSPIPAGTNAILTIPAAMPEHEGKYWVTVRNALGQVVSPAAALSVLIPPFILEHPKNQTVDVHETAVFTARAGGSEPLRYQWLRNGVNLPGQTNETLVIEGVEPGDSGSYRFVAANAAGAAQSDTAFLRVNGPARPLADKFANAELFRDASRSFRSVNRDATREPGEPRHAGKHGGKSVWLAWVAEQPGIVTFHTRGSDFDTLLAAYVGPQVDQLTEIASDEDAGGFFSSEITFNVQPGTIYMIAIDGYNGADGELQVEWFFEPTQERLPHILEHPRDQTARLGGQVTFSVATETPNLRFQWFFNGEVIPGADGPSLTITQLRPDTAGFYYARLTDGRRVTVTRMASLQLNMVGPDGQAVPAFARDKFGDVVARPDPFALFALPPVHGYAGTHLFSTFGAVKDIGEPNHCGIIGGASYWFAYTPPASGQLFLNTHGSTYDTVLAIYTSTGSSYTNLVPVACDDNNGTNGLTSRVNFPATGGVNYYIVIDGVNAATGLVRLNYALLLPMMLTDMAATNSFRFRVNATPSLPFTIQRSSNLLDWSFVLTTNTATGVYDYLDTNTTVRRFYRAMQIP